MAKKQETKKVEVEPQIETMVETVTIAKPNTRERLKPSNEWEIKDRMYNLKGGKKPENNSHSVIDKPESVNRVRPPTIIIIEIIQNIVANQKEI